MKHNLTFLLAVFVVVVVACVLGWIDYRICTVHEVGSLCINNLVFNLSLIVMAS